MIHTSIVQVHLSVIPAKQTRLRNRVLVRSCWLVRIYTSLVLSGNLHSDFIWSWNKGIPCKIWDAHIGDYEYHLLGCNATHITRNWISFLS